MTILTERLELVPASIGMLRAELISRVQLERLLGASVPATWPPELYDADAVRWTIAQMEKGSGNWRWHFYYFLHRARRLAIGAGGFKGPPSHGAVELGYSILPEHRRQGYAVEATTALASDAFVHSDISRVIAHTFPDLVASIGVLGRCGFTYAGKGDEEGTVCYELLRPTGY